MKPMKPIILQKETKQLSMIQGQTKYLTIKK